jgi:type I restriction enzyme S subunit
VIGTECWKTYKLGDCVNFVSGGTPSKKNPEYWDGNIPWVSCKDMKKAYLYDSQDHITEKGAANGTRFVSPETILIVVRGMILGQHFPVAIAKRKMAFNQDLKALQCAPNVDPKFLFHWLRGKSYEILGIVDEAAHGTKRLQTDRLQNFPLHLPPLPIQRKIAGILSAYDDLIENNTRRIEILEEMARSIYREWFVKFRFPGHEQVQMVDSDLGLIPEGWEVKKIGEVSLNFDNKRKPLSSLQRAKIPGKYPYYGAAKIFDYINNYIFEGRYLLVAEDGSVITKDRRPVLQLVDEKFWVNNHTHVIQGKEPISTNYLYLFMSDLDISGYITGAAQPKINQTNLNRIPIIVPRQIVLKQFNAIIDSLLIQVKNLKLKNDNLRKTRDLLLPRLISGEIDVENLDINTWPIAA